MNLQSIIDRAYSPDNTKAIGTITQEQAEFIGQVISSSKPSCVVEVGVASGRSSVVMALCLAELNQGHLHSFDYSERYYGDESLPVGFLINEILTEDERRFSTVNGGCTAFDVGENMSGKKIDLVFIDANHQHPWPTLDTIALLPFLSPDAVILHHDLRLYTKPKFRHGVGPKMLFDCTPKGRLVLPTGHNPLERVRFDMYGVRYTNDYKQYADELSDSLFMPQTLGNKIDVVLKASIEAFILEYYDGTSLPGTWKAVSEKL